MVHRVVIFVLARRAGEFGAALVEDASQHDIAAKTHPGAAGRTLGEIGRIAHGLVHNRIGHRLTQIFTDYFRLARWTEVSTLLPSKYFQNFDRPNPDWYLR